MSHLSLTYHLVFATWSRYSTINIAHERELYKFIYDFATQRGAKVWRIGGMPDHVHLLLDLPDNIALRSFVRSLKAESSKFMHVNPHFPDWYKWSKGYGAFVVESDRRSARIDYIRNQKAHHGTMPFVDEYRNLLADYEMESATSILGDEETPLI